MIAAAPVEVTHISRIGHREAMALTETEYERAAGLLRSLQPDDWGRTTDCAPWDVRSIALHLLGSAAGSASLREQIHQMRQGAKAKTRVGSPYWWDGANEVQIAERAGLRNEEIADAFASMARGALAARRRLPRAIRALPVLKLPSPVGRQPLSYLTDMGFTRDVWIHRVDIARAAAKELELSPEHDGRIVADLVAEWAATHGEPFVLELDGPAGGSFVAGASGEHVRIDAVEFCRILSGRAPGSGVLAHPLPL